MASLNITVLCMYNPWHACTMSVTVAVLYVCLSVCCYSPTYLHLPTLFMIQSHEIIQLNVHMHICTSLSHARVCFHLMLTLHYTSIFHLFIVYICPVHVLHRGLCTLALFMLSVTWEHCRVLNFGCSFIKGCLTSL